MILLSYRLKVELANCYLVVDEASREALLVDAGEFNEELARQIDEHAWRLRQIFITHSHYDHNGAVERYIERFSPEQVLGASAQCAGRHTRVIGEGEEITTGTLRARTLKVSGHTPDLLALYYPEQRVLFTGDALFAGSVGGTSSETARREQIGHIKSKILTLSDDVHIYSGHGPATTVYIEKHFNPFLQ